MYAGDTGDWTLMIFLERGDLVDFQKKEEYGYGNSIMEKIEKETGVDLSDVNIHYNVPQPSEFQSLAYTYGKDIYLGSGQESALSHELYHVIQQKQGIVPVQGYIDNLPYNQSNQLEQMAESNNYVVRPLKKEMKPILQRKIGFEFQCTEEKGIFNKVEEKGGRIIVERAGHGEEICKEGNVTFISDLGDYEFIIAPQDENDTGIALLRTAAGQAAEAAKDYIKIYSGSFDQYRRTDEKVETDKPFPLRKCEVGKTGKFHGYKEEQLFIRQITKTKAHPQATVGIAKENLNSFLTTYMKLVTGKKNEIDDPNIKTLDIKHGGSISANDGQVQAFKDILKEIKTADLNFLSEEAKGYVLLLRITAKSVSKGYKPRFAKSRHPFMMRTSFKNAADLGTSTGSTIKDEISAHEAETSAFIKKGNTGIIAHAYGPGEGESPVSVEQLFLHLKEEYKFYTAANRPNTYTDENSLFRDYAGIGTLQDIYTGRDSSSKLIRGKESSGLASFNVKKSTQITDLEDGPEGMIMELRGLERGVEPVNWPDFVEKIALLSRYANPHVYPSDPPAVISSTPASPAVHTAVQVPEVSLGVDDEEIKEIAEHIIAQEEPLSHPEAIGLEEASTSITQDMIGALHSESREPNPTPGRRSIPTGSQRFSERTSQGTSGGVHQEVLKPKPLVDRSRPLNIQAPEVSFGEGDEEIKEIAEHIAVQEGPLSHPEAIRLEEASTSITQDTIETMHTELREPNTTPGRRSIPTGSQRFSARTSQGTSGGVHREVLKPKPLIDRRRLPDIQAIEVSSGVDDEEIKEIAEHIAVQEEPISHSEAIGAEIAPTSITQDTIGALHSELREPNPTFGRRSIPAGSQRFSAGTSQGTSGGVHQEVLEPRLILGRRPIPPIVRPVPEHRKPVRPLYSGDKLKLYEFFRDANKDLIEEIMKAYDKQDFSTIPGTGAPLSYISPGSRNQLDEYLDRAGYPDIKSFIKKLFPGFKGLF